ncbi:MAG: hypothetical protein HYZ21_08655 [Chloroflexi bacterium]|nr:hypothetical protein [Chloroflexota bacterium]
MLFRRRTETTLRGYLEMLRLLEIAGFDTPREERRGYSTSGCFQGSGGLDTPFAGAQGYSTTE